jgi:NAD(P)-dependent dehydrogenase (short-subunit alcohol dehydrogenase family)
MRVDLDGRGALVTDGDGMIGRAIEKRLSHDGGRVIVADINLEGAESLAAMLPDAIAVTIDIPRIESTDAGVARIVEQCGRLDILVNSAGVNKRGGTVQEMTDTLLFFCDPLNTYTTGQMLAVDGGWSVGYARNF